MRIVIVAFVLILAETVAFAGRGASAGSLKNAINSGSADSIVGEVERAEKLTCLSCVDIVRGLIDHPSPEVRDVAGWWLSKRGVRVEVVDAMTARLTAQDPIAARNAADVLGGMRELSALPALAAYLASPLDEESGVAAARAIGKIGHPNGLAALKAALGHTLPGVRAAAVEAVRSLRAVPGQKAPADAQALLPGLTDADAAVRRQAAYSLGYVRDPAAVTALARALATDASPQVRKAAAWALGEIGQLSAAETLRAAQGDADPMVRSVATAALGRLK